MSFVVGFVVTIALASVFFEVMFKVIERSL